MDKTFFIFIILNISLIQIITCNSTSTSDQSHHIEYGTRQVNDYLLYRGIVRKQSFPLTIRTKDIGYPTVAGKRMHETITYIKGTDQYQNGNGGYMSLIDGGIGEKHVVLHFKSQRGHGFNFIFEIYGQ